MKKFLVVSAIAALGFSSVAFAGGLPEEMPAAPAASVSSDTGVYFGLSGGFGMTNWNNIDGMSTAVWYPTNSSNTISVGKDNGFVGRAFLGYDITRYIALELGYTYFFNKPTFTVKGQSANVKRTHDIDLMAKIKAPIVDNFDLYGKIGANYLMTSYDSNLSGAGWSNDNNFNVAFGAGADYYITPNIIANVEWLRFNGKAKIMDNGYQPQTDAFLIGLRYKFDL